jgi:hypothetical protein
VPHPLGTGTPPAEDSASVRLHRVEIRYRGEPAPRDLLPRLSAACPLQRPRYRRAGSGGPTWDGHPPSWDGKARPDTKAQDSAALAQQLQLSRAEELTNAFKGDGGESDGSEGFGSAKRESTGSEKLGQFFGMLGSLSQAMAPDLEHGDPGGHPLGMNKDAEGSGAAAAAVGLFQFIDTFADLTGRAVSAATRPLRRAAGRLLGRLTEHIPLSGAGIPGGHDPAEALEDIYEGAAKKNLEDIYEGSPNKGPDAWYQEAPGFVSPQRKAIDDAKKITDAYRAEARTAEHESGRHTWHRKAANKIEQLAKEAKRNGVLDEYVNELESIAKTLRDRAQGHRGGISGRGRR